jgi:NTP pyrophosphatase (non-canonical NTP hydrolase)
MTDFLIRARDMLRKFDSERGWKPYHTPKNLAMAIASEAGELAHLYRWCYEIDGVRLGTHEELADILIFLILMADACDIDLEQAVLMKIKQNELKYPEQ